MNNAAAYRNELQKQTDPYAYFLRQEEHRERGRSIAVDGPLPCNIVPNIPGLIAETYTLPDFKKTYVILKTDRIMTYENAVPALFYSACSTDAETPDHVLPEVIYCDHDYRDPDGKRHTPFLKPDYSPHTLLSENYMGEFAAFGFELLDGILNDPEEPFTAGEMPADEVIHAILLSAICRTDKITHVSKTLFYETDDADDAQIYKAYASRKHSVHLEAQIGRTMEKLGIVSGGKYSLSIIIPSKDHAQMLIKCLTSLKEKTHFAKDREAEILIIDNGSYDSQKEQIEAWIRENTDLSIRYLYHEEPFNFSVMCDRGAKEAKGELLLFLNDDVEFVQEDCLEHMCMFAEAPMTGAVGAKLLYPGGELIQHAGVTNLSCGPTHKLAGHPDAETYYFGANRGCRNMLALTGACLMVKREKYFQVQGFHGKMSVSYNDVDLCVNLFENGYYNVLLNECVFLHHESVSRGNDLSDSAKMQRLATEREIFYERHAWLKNKPDPFYHKDLIQDTLDYRVNVAADHEIRGRMSGVEVFACQSVRKSDRLQLNIEETGLECDLLGSSEDAYVIRGWSLFLRHDERRFDRFLLLLPENAKDKGLKVSLMPVHRADVAEVFPKQKYAGLAGFCAKIPAGRLKEGQKYRVALLYVHKALRYQIMTVGAYYEPGKGYESGSGEVL